MNERTARTARGNRIGLGLLGTVLLAGGGYLVCRSLGVLGPQLAADPVYPAAAADWVHQQRPWLWIAIAAAAAIVAVLVVRWLLVQLRTDSLHRIAIDAGHLDAGWDSGRGDGRTDLLAHALAAAVGRDVESYSGVSKVRAGVTGRPDQPALRLTVTVDPAADLARIRRRITGEALGGARLALDTEHLPTQLRLLVGRPARQRRNEI